MMPDGARACYVRRAVVGQLGDVFGGARRSGGAGSGDVGDRSLSDDDAAALEAALARLCARGRAAHPTLPLSDEDFVRDLGRGDLSPTGETAGIFVEDLFLVSACLRRAPGAVARLQALYRPAIERHARMARSDEFVDEV